MQDVVQLVGIEANAHFRSLNLVEDDATSRTILNNCTPLDALKRRK